MLVVHSQGTAVEIALLLSCSESFTTINEGQNGIPFTSAMKANVLAP